MTSEWIEKPVDMATPAGAMRGRSSYRRDNLCIHRQDESSYADMRITTEFSNFGFQIIDVALQMERRSQGWGHENT